MQIIKKQLMVVPSHWLQLLTVLVPIRTKFLQILVCPPPPVPDRKQVTIFEGQTCGQANTTCLVCALFNFICTKHPYNGHQPYFNCKSAL
jgi:hypothetical protein